MNQVDLTLPAVMTSLPIAETLTRAAERIEYFSAAAGDRPDGA